ncbi:MAG TPA: 2-amino-4-hydroxy-6-hydroxymethyldihydropteridine diphosphokinase [Thermoanaerobaculia bacterium]|nr:2-amino-4-hydroxy-6-hydroxymethyldihydropteridine diphosphokinase [Thermoanaerobaculia bacterium]
MPFSVLVALGSNLGDRALSLRRAIDVLRGVIRVVRVSAFVDTEPVEAPPGSPRFLNAVVAGYTDLDPQSLLAALLAIEARLGRRRTIRNAPRVIDIDLILHSAHLVRTPGLTLPHARYLGRVFVREPLRTLGLSWRDPVTGESLNAT